MRMISRRAEQRLSIVAARHPAPSALIRCRTPTMCRASSERLVRSDCAERLVLRHQDWRDGLELAGFDARLSLCGFQPAKVSTARMKLAACWAQKAWPASSKRSSFAPGTVLARSRSLANGMN